MVLSQSRYVELLRNRIRRDNVKLEKTLKRNRSWNILTKEYTKLKKQQTKIEKKRNQVKKIHGILNWNEEQKVMNQFKEDWDKVDLIIDRTKKSKARKQMLKKYKLWG